MPHDAQPFECSIEKYRSYLLLLARIHARRVLGAKVAPSDIVQETFLKAHAHRDQLRGKTEQEWAAWLRAILSNTMAEAVRRFNGPMRDIRLEETIDDTSHRLEQWLADSQSGPEQQAQRGELLNRLAFLLGNLPEDQRTALELKHLQGLPVSEVAVEMGRSPAAVAGLLRRGLAALRELLQESP